HHLHGIAELMPSCERAKAGGRIRHIGMSTSTDDQYEGMLDATRRFPRAFSPVDYSTANRNAAAAALSEAQRRGLAVSANTPLGGRQSAARLFARVRDVARPDFAADFDATSWAQVFLKYVVSHPAINVAIPGTTQLRHLLDNQGAGRGRLPDAALRREIERFWDDLT